MGMTRNPKMFFDLNSNDCFVNPNGVRIAANTNNLFLMDHPIDVNIDAVSNYLL
jgi:hypothetical protein